MAIQPVAAQTGMSKAGHHDRIMRIMRLGRMPGRELASFPQCSLETAESIVATVCSRRPSDYQLL